MLYMYMYEAVMKFKIHVQCSFYFFIQLINYYDYYYYYYFNYFFSKHGIIRDMWPEGSQAVTEVTKRPKSTGTIFKESMIALVANLKTKVSVIVFF